MNIVLSVFPTGGYEVCGKPPVHTLDRKENVIFHKKIAGKPIVMGRCTFEALGGPFSGRENVVVSKTLKNVSGYKDKVSIVQSIEHLLYWLEVRCLHPSDTWVVGGRKLVCELFASSLVGQVHLTVLGNLPNGQVTKYIHLPYTNMQIIKKKQVHCGTVYEYNYDGPKISIDKLLGTGIERTFEATYLDLGSEVLRE